jgi:hypothetical protein
MSGSGEKSDDLTDDIPLGLKVSIQMKKSQEQWEADQAKDLGRQLDKEELAAKEAKKGKVIMLSTEEVARREAKLKALEEEKRSIMELSKASLARLKELNAKEKADKEEQKKRMKLERQKIAEERKARAAESKKRKAEERAMKAAAKEQAIKSKRAPVVDTYKRTRAAGGPSDLSLSKVPKKPRTETIVQETVVKGKKTKKQLQEEEEAEYRIEAEKRKQHGILAKELDDLVMKRRSAKGAERERMTARIEILKQMLSDPVSAPKDALSQAQIKKKDKEITAELQELLRNEEIAIGDEKISLITHINELVPMLSEYGQLYWYRLQDIKLQRRVNSYVAELRSCTDESRKKYLNDAIANANERMYSLVTTGAPISAIPLQQASAPSDKPAETQTDPSAEQQLVPTASETAQAIDSLDDILADLDASEKKSPEKAAEPTTTETKQAEVSQKDASESVEDVMATIHGQEKALDDVMAGLRTSHGTAQVASEADPSAGPSTSMGSTFRSLSDLEPAQEDQGTSDQQRDATSPAPESTPQDAPEPQATSAETQSGDSGDSYSSPSDPHPPSPRQKKQKAADSDEEYEGEESDEAKEEARPSTSSDSEEVSSEGQEQASADDQMPLEEKYANILAKAARTNTQDMRFIPAATFRKLPKADATLAAMELHSKSTSNYTAMRTTNPYFNSEGNLKKKQCRDQRFWNDQQQSSYHLLLPKKGYVESLPIDWANLAKNGLGHLKDILAAVQLDQICSINQDYDSEVLNEFYATVFIEQDNHDYMLWMTRGQLLCITASEFAELFNLPTGPNLPKIQVSKGSEEDKSLQPDWVPNQIRQKFYPSGFVFPPNKGSVPKHIQHFKGLMKTPKHIVKTLNVSICAKGGGTDSVYNPVWKILELTAKKEKFDVARYIFSEINECQKNRTDKMRYGSYIMHMILRRTSLPEKSFTFDKKCFLSKFRPQKDDNEDSTPFYNILEAPQQRSTESPEPATRHSVEVPQPDEAMHTEPAEPQLSPTRDSVRDSPPPAQPQASMSVDLSSDSVPMIQRLTTPAAVDAFIKKVVPVQIAAIKTRQDDLKQEMTALKQELKADMADLKASVNDKFEQILSILQSKPSS